MAVTSIGFLITLNFTYSQSSGQVNSPFNIYENDIHKVRIQFPSNWEQKDEHSNSIVRFIVPGTGGVTKPTGVLITIFQRLNVSNLDEFIDFFHKGRYAKQSDFTIVNSSETTLAGIKARQIILYEQITN